RILDARRSQKVILATRPRHCLNESAPARLCRASRDDLILQRRWSRRHMTHPLIPQKNPSGIARLPAGLAGFCCEDLNCPECLRAYRKGLAFKRQERAARRLRLPPPDGLKSAAQAAAKLGCSIKTLNGHVASGALKYIALGHGKRRQRRMFTDADINQFVEAQSKKDIPCPSDATRALRSGSTISKSTVV